MKREDQLLFLCCRQDFQEAHRQAVLDLCQNYGIRWEAVFSKAEQHGVAPMVYINLCQRNDLGLKIPATISDHYHKVMLQNSITKERGAQRLVEALAYFKERSIDILLIKGAALDLLVYQNPAYVASGDMDIVLRLRLEEFEADDLLHLHQSMYRNGIEYDFFEHHDMTINGTLPVNFSRIWADARRADYRGQPVYLMSPEDMLISLCVNSCRKRFFWLKSLMDIAETLCLDKGLCWELMVEKAKNYDCQNIIYTALQVTQMTLGCELPVTGLKQLGVSKTRAAIVDVAVALLLRYTSLPASPNAGFRNRQRPADLPLILPYLAYRGYQTRYKLFKEIRSRN